MVLYELACLRLCGEKHGCFLVMDIAPLCAFAGNHKKAGFICGLFYQELLCYLERLF
jgi:hypothetical protein